MEEIGKVLEFCSLGRRNYKVSSKTKWMTYIDSVKSKHLLRHCPINHSNRESLASLLFLRFNLISLIAHYLPEISLTLWIHTIIQEWFLRRNKIFLRRQVTSQKRERISVWILHKITPSCRMDRTVSPTNSNIQVSDSSDDNDWFISLT